MADNLTRYMRRLSPRGKRSYTVRSFYWAFLAFSALAIISWASGNLRQSASSSYFHVKRADDALQGSFEPECRLVRHAKDQCSFVRENCSDLEDGLLSYIQLYYCTLADAKPLAFIILLLWLSLLFSTIGIAASDFLCIDLSTLASILGMSESLTGVTFLAFGNGSPDVFSTFAAMKSNSGSLAIGELLGAASFITSVVAGSMALVQPFRVARRSFVRDVGYFVIAVSFSMVLLADGRLHVWESATMVGLYCFYVVLVVTWHWYLVRRRRAYERNLAARCHFHIPDNQELDIEEEVEDDDPGVASESRSLLRGASTEDFETLQRSDLPAWKDGDEDDETRNRYLAEIRENMHVFRPSTRRRNTLNPIRPSLVGALEFQTVLSSLQKSRSNIPINLDRYFDDPGHGRGTLSYGDDLSIASHPRTSKPAGSSRFLSPNSASGSARTRAVSANDATSLRLNTNVFESRTPQPLLTVSRPSRDDELVAPGVSQSDQASSSLHLPPSGQPPRSPSPGGTGRSLTPSLLAPPGTFHSPNYQADTPLSHSTLDVSPLGTSCGMRSAEGSLGSPLSPFPPFQDALSATSSRAPSIRLAAVSSPTQRLHIHEDGPDGSIRRSSSPAKWTRISYRFVLQSIFPVFFPTLVGWKSKTFLERVLGIIAAPSVLLLTLTLPVVDPVQPDVDIAPIILTPADGEESAPAPRVRLPEDSPLIRTLEHEFFAEDENGSAGSKAQARYDRQRWDSELPAIQQVSDPSAAQTKDWCQWLVWVQLLVGPFFVAIIAWTTFDPELKARSLLLPSLCSLIFSLICITSLTLSTRNGGFLKSSAFWRPFLALLGFVVAIFWIATIATEVVSLLKTVGVILNISDSLLGLTVFAVGNSLGDLVADITVARLGYPVMALSACFGGPMLNILLGIGLGGLYMTLNAQPDSVATRTGSYDIPISKVLIISGVTLLATLLLLLIIVPLNKWRMDRKIGWGLIVLWVISTVGNVIAELYT